MARYLLIELDDSKKAGGLGGLLLLLIIIGYFAYDGISSSISTSKTQSYNSELLEKTIQDINTLTNNKEKITPEQCLVYVQFDRRCEVNDYFNFIPKERGLSRSCSYNSHAEKKDKIKIEERCSTQKDRTYCEDNYLSYCEMCKSDSHECEIEDNSLVIHDDQMPCSKKLQNSLDKTILAHCTELVYRNCHDTFKRPSTFDCKDPFWNGRLNDDDEKQHDSLDYRDSYYWKHMAESYKMLTGRELQ